MTDIEKLKVRIDLDRDEIRLVIKSLWLGYQVRGILTSDEQSKASNMALALEKLIGES